MQEVFTALRALLAKQAQHLVVKTDSATEYYCNTAFMQKNKKPVFFGAVSIKKSYVSVHLMASYLEPKILQDLSPALLKRMQGKACFNFKKLEPELFDELDAYVVQCLYYYRQSGYLKP
ncbi:MAG: hypothetical protein RLZZ502_1082 [Pseudomonadota bacterium]